MKKILLFLSLITVVAINMQAQVPNKFNYQAVARNSQGQSLANANITLRLTILDGGANGNSVYSETRQATTNQLGLFTVGIGGPGATITTGNFAAIDWSTGNKYIKVEADPLGGNNFSVLGNSEMLSVPYALYAVNGKVGPQGPIGLTGATGPAGPVGATGPQGVAGPVGATGPQGPIGLTGPAGPVGAAGPQGVPGPSGATGPQGPIGLTGPAGPQGPIGLTGATGPAGPQGPQGIPGAGTVNGTTNFIGKFTAPDVMGNSTIFDNGTNVGIGTTTPVYKLQVPGTIYGNDGIMNNSLTVGGTNSTGYKLSVIDGSVALYNSTDSKLWTMNYSSSTNTLNFNEGGITPRMSIENGGNVGIGLSNPAHRLDVGGGIRASANIQSQGNLIVDGSATINNGGGVAYNPNSGTNLKIVPFTTANLTSILGPHEISSEFIFSLPVGFSSTPKVFVGDIDATGGTVGQLYMVELVVYGCTVTTCKARLINKSAGPVDYFTKWNMVAIGN
jgi:hypothetical protein